jgi:type IV pilus assembly protein PilB
MATQMNPAALAGLTGIARRLVVDGTITDVDARKALEASTKQKIPLGTYLIEHALANGAQVAMASSAEFGVPLFDAEALDLTQAPVKLISEKLITQHRALPLFKRGNRLFVGVSDPTNLRALDEIKFQSNSTIEPILISEEQLARAIEQALSASSTSIEGLDEAEGLDTLDSEGGDLDADEPAGGIDASGSDDAPVVKFVNKVLVDAIKRGASDIHFEPYESNYRVRFRMDGMLRAVASPPVKLTPRISSRLKVMSGLDIAERRVPQDGRIKLNLSKTKSVDFRVSTCPTLFGEKVVLRILDASAAKLGIEKLGYEEPQQKALSRRDRETLRHGAGDWTDRFRQDGIFVYRTQYPQYRRTQHFHGRGSGRNPLARGQPGSAESEARHDLRRGVAFVSAPGSRHHHGRRNPRHRNRGNRGQGRANRTHGVVDVAHE